MDTREIKEQGEFLYSKSSQFIINVFIIAQTVMAFVELYASTWIGLAAVLLVAPIELAIYKALFKAYNRKAREVKTKEYILEGFKDYKKWAPIFVGKKLYIWAIKAVIIALAMLLLARNKFGLFPLALKAAFSGNATVLTGNVDIMEALPAILKGTLETGVSLGIYIAVVLAQFVGFIVNFYYTLTFFFAVENEGYDIGDSLQASRQAMTGNIMAYISLLLKFAIRFILALMITSFVNISLQELFYMILTYVPQIVAIPLSIVFNLIIAFVGVMIALVLYDAKLQLATTVFYKEITGE